MYNVISAYAFFFAQGFDFRNVSFDLRFRLTLVIAYVERNTPNVAALTK